MRRVPLLVLLAFAGGSTCDTGVPSGLAVDTDGDGIPDVDETAAGLNPHDPDTDHDGLSDFDEIFVVGTDPLVADTDGDQLSDGDEVVIWLTNPFRADTDFDSLIDGDEVNNIGTSPLLRDTDFDGLSDGLELDPHFGSDPLNPDTDFDGFLDGEEIALRLDLLAPNPIGRVVDVYCADFLAVATDTGTGVYEVSDVLGGFSSGFLPNDSVALALPSEGFGDRTGAVRANLRTLETGFAHFQGDLGIQRGVIVAAEPETFSIRIILNTGAAFEVNFTDFDEISDWFIGDEVLIILPRHPTDPFSAAQMLNISRCEAVLVF